MQVRHPDLTYLGEQRGDDVGRAYASPDLVLFPSLWETFGNIRLEAMASGVPTVAFDDGAAREYLRHGLHGVCLGTDDPAAFVDAAVRVAKLPRVIRTTMGLEARGAVSHLHPGLANRSCAVLPDATLACWGYNAGHLYREPEESPFNLIPTPVSGASGVLDASIGWRHSCLLRDDGKVLCWGSNSAGQLGSNAPYPSGLPQVVAEVSAASGIASGFKHSCAVVANDAVRCWGARYSTSPEGYIGIESSQNYMVAGIVNASQLAAGDQHSCGSVTDGTVRCWGSNHYGQRGNDSTTAFAGAVPVSLNGAQGIAAAQFSSCAIATSGVFCWGWNGGGQLGNGSRGADGSWDPAQSTNPLPVLSAEALTSRISRNGFEG